MNEIRQFINEIKKINNNNLINETTYSRVVQILRGVVPSIRSVGILTAENPDGNQETPEFNKRANKELIDDLMKMHLGFHAIKGKYGVEENSFLVPNIRYDEVLELGRKYDQESVIFGEKTYMEKDGETYTGMVFRLILCETGEIDSERSVFINDNDLDDFYSEVKGRKFVIPFFDMPGKDYSNATWHDDLRGKIAGVEDVPPNLQERIDISLRRIFSDNPSKKSLWLHRNVIHKIVSETKKN